MTPDLPVHPSTHYVQRFRCTPNGGTPARLGFSPFGEECTISCPKDRGTPDQWAEMVRHAACGLAEQGWAVEYL